LKGADGASPVKAVTVCEEAKKRTSIENEEDFRHIYTQMEEAKSIGSFYK
jgi:hypothetical protein